MSAPMLEAQGLTKHFPTGGLLRRGPVIQAVNDVGLTLRKGEAIGLVGESGSGKSTLGRMLMGLIPATAGHIRFDGETLTTMSRATQRQLRRRMQMIFQDPFLSLDPKRRIGAQIADGLVIHKIGQRADHAARVEELMSAVGLDPAGASRLPQQFSGGQRQRIAIARALATDPDVIVADEPVSALDVSVQAQVIKLLSDLRRERQLAMIFISHDLPVVRYLCDQVVVLYLGRVMERGDTARVFGSPRHPYTRALLAAEPGRSLRGQTRQSGALLTGEPPSPANPPSGCVFRGRCPMAVEACAREIPPLKGDSGHSAACIMTNSG